MRLIKSTMTLDTSQIQIFADCLDQGSADRLLAAFYSTVFGKI